MSLAACSGDDNDAPATAGGRAPAPMPVPRTEMAGAPWEGEIAVVGGFTADGKASDAAHVYDPEANRWSELPRLPEPRHHAAVAALNDRLFVVGGYDAASMASERVWSIGRGDSQWREEPSLPVGRAAHAVQGVGERLIVAGGVIAGAPTATTVAFTPGIRWREGPPLARAREHLAMTTFDGIMYVIGGRAGTENFADVESWNGSDPTWTREPNLNDARGGTAASTVSRGPCVAGGEELTPGGETIASIECLEDGAWKRVARLANPRHGLVVASIGEELHVIGGGPEPGLTVSDDHEVVAL